MQIQILDSVNLELEIREISDSIGNSGSYGLIDDTPPVHDVLKAES